jgi:hypothetical protein
MNSVSGSRYSWMKYAVAAAILVSSLFLGACGPKFHMVPQERKPVIAAKSNKAVLVIIRTTSFGWGSVVDNYLDGKMIGQTHRKEFFVTDVTPGTHYVISHADNTDTARLHFEAGKIYLLQQGIYPGWNVTTRYSPMTTDEFAKEVQEADFVVYDTTHPGNDMSPKDFKEAKDDFEKEVKEGSHKDTLGYKGYRKLK